MRQSPAWGTAPCSWPVRTRSAHPPTVRAAIAVLREAVAVGITHIDTSDYYGPHVTNQIIKEDSR